MITLPSDAREALLAHCDVLLDALENNLVSLLGVHSYLAAEALGLARMVKSVNRDQRLL